MSRFKYDIEINLKHEEEIKDLLVFSSATVILNYVIFSVVGFIDIDWLCKFCSYISYYVVAIPAFYYFIKHKNSFKDLVSGTSVLSVVYGLVIAVVMTIGVSIYFCSNDDIYLGGVIVRDVWVIFKLFLYYGVMVAFTEEFIYRQCFGMLLSKLLYKVDWIIPIITSVCFGLVHLIHGSWIQVWISFILGLLISLSVRYIKQCNFVTMWVAHMGYDIMINLSNYIFQDEKIYFHFG